MSHQISRALLLSLSSLTFFLPFLAKLGCSESGIHLDGDLLRLRYGSGDGFELKKAIERVTAVVASLI